LITLWSLLVLICSVPGGEVNWLIIMALIMPKSVVQFLSFYHLMELTSPFVFKTVESNTCLAN
jgi:hypothetical protein